MGGKLKKENIFKQLFDLTGQVAIITGAQGTLGSQYAKTLAQTGAAVAVFDISKKINPLIAQLIKEKYPVATYVVDITKRPQVEKAVKAAVKKFGPPTILINNAGLGSMPDVSAKESGPFEDYPEICWDTMLDSHLKGMLIVSQVVIREMRKANKKGSIVNISSHYGIVTPQQAIYDFRRKDGEEYYKPIGYTVAKSGVIGFTKWIAEYCGPFGIRVNTLVPGGVEDPTHHPEFKQEYIKRTILGRMATPTDYNGAILFLASKASDYMTGAMLIVDGGWTAR